MTSKKTEAEIEKTPWEVLSAIDVNGRTEQKNGLTYLSWAWAWGELKKAYPYAWYRKHENGSGFPAFYDVMGYAFVKVTVGLDRTGDHEVTELLPVLDHRNKPIQGPNAFEVNNALQRCLAKAIAYHGLGHYIYAGEDLPDTGSQASRDEATGGSSPVQGVTHPGANEAPPAAPNPNAPTIFHPEGKGYVQDVSPDIITQAFLSFIPLCKTDEALTAFYASNKGARDHLLAVSPERHKTVMDAFSAAKRAFVKPAT